MDASFTATERDFPVNSNRGQQDFYRLLEKLPMAAYTCDPEGRITYYNPSAVRLWGRAPKLNHPADRYCGSYRLFSIDGQAIPHERCWMAQALINNREYNGREIVIECPDGQRKNTLAHANPIRDEAGRLIGAANVLVDITERKRMEEVLREMNRAKDDFLAILAHELRNPLPAIRNAVEILRRQNLAEGTANWAVGVIDRQVRQITRLIHDLVDLARITHDQLELKRQRVKLAEVICSAVETSQPLIEAGRHEFTVNIPPTPLYLDVDPLRMVQVISNLLNNAAKYTGCGGHIWLVVERDNDQAVISVRDTGIGIDPRMMPRVFETFTRGEQSLEAGTGGLGVGLSLVKRIVEMHGGTVRAHSDGPGRGSTFEVRLPLTSSEAVDEAPANTRTISGTTRPLRILVVDDLPETTRSMALLLGLTGHEVRTAADGLEAVASAQEFQPDVVLLDIGMPKMNGYDVARRLRLQPWNGMMVLIALSGWGRPRDKERAHRAGFDYHLVKPIDPRTLLELLEQISATEKNP